MGSSQLVSEPKFELIWENQDLISRFSEFVIGYDFVLWYRLNDHLWISYRLWTELVRAEVSRREGVIKSSTTRRDLEVRSGYGIPLAVRDAVAIARGTLM